MLASSSTKRLSLRKTFAPAWAHHNTSYSGGLVSFNDVVKMVHRLYEWPTLLPQLLLLCCLAMVNTCYCLLMMLTLCACSAMQLCSRGTLWHERQEMGGKLPVDLVSVAASGFGDSATLSWIASASFHLVYQDFWMCGQGLPLHSQAALQALP